jgi:hypothetical protein
MRPFKEKMDNPKTKKMALMDRMLVAPLRDIRRRNLKMETALYQTHLSLKHKLDFKIALV